MFNLPANEYVEVREGKTCIVGTRIGLDVFVYAYRRGKTPEALLEAFPSIGSLAKVHGIIDFILKHPQFVGVLVFQPPQNREVLSHRFDPKLGVERRVYGEPVG